jgi:hypothetical protein
MARIVCAESPKPNFTSRYTSSMFVSPPPPPLCTLYTPSPQSPPALVAHPPCCRQCLTTRSSTLAYCDCCQVVLARVCFPLPRRYPPRHTTWCTQVIPPPFAWCNRCTHGSTVPTDLCCSRSLSIRNVGAKLFPEICPSHEVDVCFHTKMRTVALHGLVWELAHPHMWCAIEHA